MVYDSFPQDKVNIKKSEEKILIKGEKYFIHNIAKGQTLYSIAKAYGVSQKDIALKNPGVFSELKTGQSLLIPFAKPNNNSSISHISLPLVTQLVTLFV